MRLLALLGFVALSTVVCAQQKVTITAMGDGATNSVSIGSDQFFTLKRLSSSTGSGALAYVLRNKLLIAYYSDSNFTNKGAPFSPDTLFAGPATVLVKVAKGATYAEASLEISPTSYPPATVIREGDGPMRVTLQESTDLKHWRLSTNGAIHTLTNTNAKMFFRIKLEKAGDEK